jgi:hypothetical protein
MADNPREELAHLTASLRRTVELKKARLLSGKKPSLSVAPPQKQKPPSPKPPASTSPLDTFQDDTSLSKGERLTRLRDHIGDCQRCPLGHRESSWPSAWATPTPESFLSAKAPGMPKTERENLLLAPRDNCWTKFSRPPTSLETPRSHPGNGCILPTWSNAIPMIDPSDNTKRGNDRPPDTRRNGGLFPIPHGPDPHYSPALHRGLGRHGGESTSQNRRRHFEI